MNKYIFNEDNLIKDEEYSKKYDEVVVPYVTAREEKVTVIGTDGLKLQGYCYINVAKPSDDKRLICISHGYTEFAKRYTEVIYYFLKTGYSVAILDHRGHGYSDRMVENKALVHIDRFEKYVEDYHAFVNILKDRFSDYSFYLFAHSMGGCIGAYYIEKYPDDFKKAVLTSPMLEVISNGLPVPGLIVYGKIMKLIGKATMPFPGQRDYFLPDESFEDSCSANYGRWAKGFEYKKNDEHYQLCCGSINWLTESYLTTAKVVKNANMVKIPVLLCQAESDNMVLPGGQDRFVSGCKGCVKKKYPGTKHEIFNSDYDLIKNYYKDVFEFFS